MNIYLACLKNKRQTAIYGILLISAVLPALLVVKNIKISPDSMMYALISQEIVAGNGLRVPIVRLEDNYDISDGTIPYVGEPPLLPLLFALMGGVSSQSFAAAQILNVIGHACITILTFLLIRQIYANSGIALIAGILVSLSFPILSMTHHIWTESLFIGLTVASLYFLNLCRDSERGQLNRNLIISSICISVSVFLRFAGVSLIPVFFWGAFILARNKNIQLKNISIIFLLFPLVTTASLFIYTYYISGSIHGWTPPPPGRSYLSAFTGTVEMIFLQFHLGKLLITFIAIFTFLFILYIFISSNVRRELLQYVHSGLDIIIVFIISYTALITYAMVSSQTVFELRFMSPLVPFLFILCIIAITAVWELIRRRGFPGLSLCGIVLSLSILAFGNFYKTYQHSGEFSYKQTGHYHILKSPTFNQLKESYGEKEIITSNRPFHLSFFGGFTTIKLPHKRFNKNYPIPENMETFLPERMSKYGSRVLALFEKADEQYEGRYIAELFKKREDNNRFTLAHEFTDGVIYHLKE